MSGHGAQGGQVSVHFPGIFQGLIAGAIGAACGPLATWCWSFSFHQEQPDWAKNLVAGLIGAAVLLFVWSIWGIAGWQRQRLRHRTARAEGRRLAIYVAELAGDDATGSARASVINTIRHELGRDTVEVNTAGIQLAPKPNLNETEAAIEITRQARALLRRHNGDLLIWGARRTLRQTDTIELHFVSASDDRGRDKPFALTDNLLLEADFAPEMGTALAALTAALAAPAVSSRGTYIARQLIPVADRLAPFSRNPGRVLRPDDRARILTSYALICGVIGEQSGDASRLDEAVAAYRAALEEYPRDRVPLDWAMTQNNLGIALRTLGERESGTARLDDAVAAYRLALEERTRDRVPLDWAYTRENLGNVLALVAERTRDRGRMAEALACVRDAAEVYREGGVGYTIPSVEKRITELKAALAEMKK